VTPCKVRTCREPGDPTTSLVFDIHGEVVEVSVPICEMHKGLVCAYAEGAPVTLEFALDTTT
jgi:hypothetical protein